MFKQSSRNARKTVSVLFLCLVASTLSLRGESSRDGKILGSYFEEWSIYYAGYNIANLQQNGVANKLTHLFYASHFARSQEAPMTSDDFLLVIDEEGHVESKRLDALSDLADLFVAMNPGVSRIGFQRCRAEVGNLQLCRRRLHFLPPLPEAK